MEDKIKSNKTQNIKTTATTVKTRPRPPMVDPEPDKNLFARMGSVSRSPPMLTRSESRASVCSVTSLPAEEKTPKVKPAKQQALTKGTADRDTANAEGEFATICCQDKVIEASETAEQDPGSNIIQEIYNEKESLESLLFNESNKINRSAIRLIMAKWAILESKLIEMALENNKAKTKINKLLLENMKLKKKMKHSPTYAGALKAPIRIQPGMQPVDNLKQKTEVVLIKPTDENESVSNDEIKVKVTRALEKVKNKLKVKNIRQMNKKGLVIEVDSIKNKEIIKAVNLEKIGLKVEEPRRIEPMIIIYDVDKEYKPEELKEELILKNIDGIAEGDSGGPWPQNPLQARFQHQ